MRPLLLSLIIILAMPMSAGNGELEKVRVLDKYGNAHEGRYVRTWDGVNILYDNKWREIYRFGRY